MTRKILLIAALAALPMIVPAQAEAREKCKQYTKTIRIDGSLELGVGKACRNENGSWRIVSLKGPYEAQQRLKHHIYDDLHNDGYKVVVIYDDHDTHYYKPHYYRSAYYHAPHYYSKKAYKKARHHYKQCRNHHH